MNAVYFLVPVAMLVGGGFCLGHAGKPTLWPKGGPAVDETKETEPFCSGTFLEKLVWQVGRFLVGFGLALLFALLVTALGLGR